MAKQEMAGPDLVSCGAAVDLKSKFYQMTQKYEHKIGEKNLCIFLTLSATIFACLNVFINWAKGPRLMKSR